MEISKSTTRILAFDPGELTGISYLVDGVFMLGAVARPEELLSEVTITSLTRMTEPTTVLIESIPPHGIPNELQMAVYERLRRWYTTAGYHVVLIRPNQWKGLVLRHKVSATHIMDATDMAFWYIQREAIYE